MIFHGIEICCPHCRGDLGGTDRTEGELRCVACDRRFPVVLGIPDLRVFPDPYIEAEADRTKGLELAARSADLSFPQLVDFYYRTTPVVPPPHARRYTRGVVAAVARAETALVAWESVLAGNAQDGILLEVGCGTAPLLVAAAGRFAKLVGVDIAFRWLVVGRKRLTETGLDIPLICACAEALPFPDEAFDRVAAESVLEHVRDQRQALAECYRVMRPSGSLFASTPNRYSLGPDPQVGIWAGGILPDRWVARYVRRMGGVPPKRRLLSVRSLSRLIRETGFGAPRVLLPEVPPDQRRHFGTSMRVLIDLYRAARCLPLVGRLLYWIGPFLQAVAEKPAARRP
ncbi:MAG: methyltransferase domain-containing protein [Candidatus Rokubacteria bacterium]|nr:methyltransferase domain-containing protein [Candidatus Rokubacteria bacterium]